MSRQTRLNALADIYFWYYVFFVAFRSGILFYTAGSIYELSRTPLRYIRNVSKRNWCVDVSRIQVIKANLILIEF